MLRLARVDGVQIRGAKCQGVDEVSGAVNVVSIELEDDTKTTTGISRCYL